MENPPFDADYQQENSIQQRKKKMLLLILVIFTFYVFSSSNSQLNRNNKKNQDDQYGFGIENAPQEKEDEKKALKLLQDSQSSVDGYKELHKAFYDRIEDDKNEEYEKQNTKSDLRGNSSKDLLFATIYSLKKKNFDGEWVSESKNNLFGYFDNNQGKFNSIIEEYKNDLQFQFKVLYDQYIDHKYIQIYINYTRETNFTVIDKQVFLHNLNLTYRLYNDFYEVTENPQYHDNIYLYLHLIILQNQEIIPIDFMIIFNEQNDSEKYINKYSPYLKIKITNKNQEDIYSNINISAEIDLVEENQYKGRQTMYYSIFLTIILSIQFFFVIKMMRSFLVQENEEQKFSLISLSIVFIWDGFFCFLHLLYAFLYGGISVFKNIIYNISRETELIDFLNKDNLKFKQGYLILSYKQLQYYFITKKHQFHYYITPCFLYMILWNIFERGLITIVWRNRHIVRNARRGKQVIVNKSYIFGFMMIRSIIIEKISIYFLIQNQFYYRGCPENIGTLSPQYSTCVVIILLLIAQVLVLYAQEFLGPRFFIPARFQKDSHNYYYKLPRQVIHEDVENQGQNDECTICIAELTMQPVIQQKSNYFKKLVIKAKQKQNYVMKTPCEHKYHIPCLLKWMEVKMECPTCRAPLPPVL